LKPVCCIPPWEQQTGTLLIVGSAPSAHEDLARARALRPQAQVMAINGAGQVIEDIDHLLCGHVEKAQAFYDARMRKFPDSKPFAVHGTYRDRYRDGKPVASCVTHLWKGVATGGTSAWVAVRIGKAMGFEERILCGCPMEATGYVEGESDGIGHDCARLGLGEGRMFNNYRATFAKRAAEEGQGVFSMSGWSQSLLGAPC
jgi:hypothetical protein